MRIIFRQEELDTLTVGSSLLISAIEACTQAEVVKLIFDLHLGGKSIIGIVKELKDRSI